MIACDEADRLIGRRLDGVATAGDEAALAAHVAACPACAQDLAVQAALDAALSTRFSRAEPSPAFAARIHRRIAAEPLGAPGWLVDVLNAGGLLAFAAFALPFAGTGAAGALLAAAAVAVSGYPLIVSALSSEPGSAVASTRERLS